MSGEEIRNLIKRSGALKEGHFLLTSGRHSPRFYLLALLFQDPRRAARVGRALALLFSREEPQAVVGPAMGGVIPAYEVARALGARFLFAEKAEEEGERVFLLRRGLRISEGEKVLVVEDVVTTGGSTRGVVELVRRWRGEVVGVGAVVDRSGGRASFDVPFRALLREEVPDYLPSLCPLCARGLPLVSPKDSLL